MNYAFKMRYDTLKFNNMEFSQVKNIKSRITGI